MKMPQCSSMVLLLLLVVVDADAPWMHHAHTRTQTQTRSGELSAVRMREKTFAILLCMLCFFILSTVVFK